MQQELGLFEERQILSVSQIVKGVKFQLETKFASVWVKGEVSNLKVPPSGHYYFTLKDSEAQIRAICFRTQNRYLKFTPEDGMDVVARGAISVYSPRGELQLVVEHMEPLGRGALQVAFEQLKERLAKEGLFDPAHKKKLPLLPAKIGVVTSPTGAAIQDILKVLQRRNDRLNVLIFPTKVQGAGAAQEIARGIQYLNTRKDIDVIMVARGGGSLEDLWAFNEEVVAGAIYNSRIPIISAVGHEVDFTIADFVADLRAPTPSAAAEIVSGAREELSTRVRQLVRQSTQAVRLFLQHQRRRLHGLTSSRGFVDAESKLRFFLQRLDELQARLLKTLPAIMEPLRRKVAEHSKDVQQQIRFYVEHQKHRLVSFSQQLSAYSPLAVLERGYAIVTSAGDEIIRDPAQVAEGEAIQVQVARGKFRARKEREPQRR